jgi:hypothetical protein
MKMSAKVFWKAQKQRGKVLSLARKLARTGHYSSHNNIIAELEVVEGFAEARRALTEGPIRAQLDKLCTLAQAPQASAHDLAVFLSKIRGRDIGDSCPLINQL